MVAEFCSHVIIGHSERRAIFGESDQDAQRKVAAALDAGADWINDVWGLRYDRNLATLAARAGAPLIVMHNRMQPEDTDYWQRVQSLPFGPIYEYEDVAAEVRDEIKQSLAMAQTLGAPRWLLVTDPGIGFGKTLAQQLELIDRLDEARTPGYPLLFGSSRKSFIGKVLGDLPPEERLEGTLATCVLAAERGADIVRVHDVAATVRAMRMVDAVVRRRST